MISQREFVDSDDMAMNAKPSFVALGKAMDHLKLRVDIGAEPEAQHTSWQTLAGEKGWAMGKGERESNPFELTLQTSPSISTSIEGRVTRKISSNR